MVRLTEIRLPLEHAQADLKADILKKLHITDKELLSFTIYKRSYDARKKGAIVLVYIVDATTTKNKSQIDDYVFI